MSPPNLPMSLLAVLALALLVAGSSAGAAAPTTAPAGPADVEAALGRAGENRPQIERALAAVPEDQQEGMGFLVAHMPDRDLTALSADFLLQNVALAYEARRDAAWTLPDAIFLNNVLPYANLNERRDDWRGDFRGRFAPVVKDAQTPGEAAAILNNHVWQALDVRYDPRPEKPDQSPYESTRQSIASCTGLSILLVDACRAVGVPARVVGTPLWSDGSGNHTWVEVWQDGEWHFTGACEPTGKKLDEGWFTDRASKATADDPVHAIYAASFARTPLSFPMIWARGDDSFSATNVTDRYTRQARPLAAGQVRTRFSVFDADGTRRAAELTVTSAGGETLYEGRTKDARFDTNDHVTVALRKGETYTAAATFDGREAERDVTPEEEGRVVRLELPAKQSGAADAGEPDTDASSGAVAALRRYLETPAGERQPVAEQPFAGVSLTKADAEQARDALWQDHVSQVKATRAGEIDDRLLKLDGQEMKLAWTVYGDKPRNGRSLFIAMHGGGGAPAALNDDQWRGMQQLYRPAEGVYVAPRAPTNDWDLWHKPHVDDFFDRLIADLVVFADVDPDRVYLMGYSAGGDGVYQLAPRMADRFAAASMMAGHPNDASPLSLRDLPFSIQVGGEDAAYDRNKVAAQWGETLDELRAADPDGYDHWTKVYEGKGHWMDREDAVAVGWMAGHSRDLFPNKIVWKQDDVTHERFYWLAVPEPKAGSLLTATRDGQAVDLRSDDAGQVIVRLSDEMLDLDQPVTVTSGDRVLYEGNPARTVAGLARTLGERGDPRGMFPAEVAVDLGASDPATR